MGSGKSTVGKELAKKLGYRFVDLDKMIEKKTDKTIDKIFQKQGEEKFRVIEKKQLYETQKIYNAVISTGGGTPCFFDNMDWMNEHGATIYLKMPVGALFHRLGNSKVERPLLSGLSDVELMEQIMTHLAKREPFYLKANHVMDGHDVRIDKLVKLLKDQLK